MFYLVFFFKVSLQRKLAGLIFIISLLFFSVALPTISFWRPYLLEALPWQKESSYFLALIADSNDLSTIVSRMRNLPGVKKAEALPSDLLKKELDEMVEDGGMTLDELRATYGAIRIDFESHLKPESELLVREYLIKFVGEERVTAGKIRKEQNEKKLILRFLEQWVQVMLLGTIALFNLLAFMILRPVMLKDSYLIEKFQRKTKVASKSFSLSFTMFALLGTCWTLILGECSYLYLLGIPLLFFIEWIFLQRRFVWISE